MESGVSKPVIRRGLERRRCRHHVSRKLEFFLESAVLCGKFFFTQPLEIGSFGVFTIQNLFSTATGRDCFPNINFVSMIPCPVLRTWSGSSCRWSLPSSYCWNDWGFPPRHACLPTVRSMLLLAVSQICSHCVLSPLCLIYLDPLPFNYFALPLFMGPAY